jgi:hypothetical protein
MPVIAGGWEQNICSVSRFLGLSAAMPIRAAAGSEHLLSRLAGGA